MIEEAEKFKDDDERMRKQVEAKNKLESYCYYVKQSVIDDAKMGESLGDNKEEMSNRIEETLQWLEETHETEEIEAKQKELESYLSPLIQQAYQSNMPQEASVPETSQEAQPQPKVEEVD